MALELGSSIRYSGSNVSVMRKLGLRRMCTRGERSRSERTGDDLAVKTGEERDRENSLLGLN